MKQSKEFEAHHEISYFFYKYAEILINLELKYTVKIVFTKSPVEQKKTVTLQNSNQSPCHSISAAIYIPLIPSPITKPIANLHKIMLQNTKLLIKKLNFSKCNFPYFHNQPSTKDSTTKH